MQRFPPNVITLRERTLANILLDIQAVGPIIWRERRGWDSLSDERQIELLDRKDELQAEARAMIETLTGVSWDAIQEACL